MSGTTNEKPPHVEAARQRLKAAAKERPEPRFGARRTRKPRRTKDDPAVQRRFPFAVEVQE
jgi:hypothetical protein